MSKRNTRIMSLCLVLCFLLTTVSIASASPLGDGPVVTPLTGSADFTVKVISLEDLPGTVKPDDGGVLPSTAPSGAKQFSGDGVQVTGLVGSASVCFPMKSSRYGWVGTVYSWDGTTWSKLATTMTENEEGLNAQACAVIYGDGIFALALGYKPPANKEISECTDIQIIYPFIEEDEELNRLYITGGLVYPGIPVDTIVKYELRNIQPSGSLSGPGLSATGVVVGIEVNPEDPTDFISYVVFPKGTYVDYSEDWRDITFTVRFYTQGCYKDFAFPEDLERL